MEEDVSFLTKNEEIKYIFKKSRLGYINVYIWFFILEIILYITYSYDPKKFEFVNYLLLIPLILIIKIEIEIFFHRYYITDKRFVDDYNFLSRNTKSINHSHITNSSLEQGIFDRIFDIGSINLNSVGINEEIAFKKIEKVPNIGEVKRIVDSYTNSNELENLSTHKNTIVQINKKENITESNQECPFCKNNIFIDDKFCGKCGYSLKKEKKCSKCEHINSSTSTFCSECGNKF